MARLKQHRLFGELPLKIRQLAAKVAALAIVQPGGPGSGFGRFRGVVFRTLRHLILRDKENCFVIRRPNHFVHALGLLIVSFLVKTGTFSEFATSWVCGLLLAGIVIFSGSLYLLAVTGNRALGAITPIGGVCFIAGWIALAWFVARH